MDNRFAILMRNGQRFERKFEEKWRGFAAFEIRTRTLRMHVHQKGDMWWRGELMALNNLKLFALCGVQTLDVKVACEGNDDIFGFENKK